MIDYTPVNAKIMKQIKVTGTRMHVGVPVADAELVFMKEERIARVGELIEKRGGIYLFNNDRKHYHIASHHEVYLQHAQTNPARLTVTKPILISRTEKIEEGDWYLWDGKIVKDHKVPTTGGNMRSKDLHSNPFKILALPENFSPKHLQTIVDGKLKEGKILVECVQEEPIPMTYKGVDSRGDYLYYCPKCGAGGSYMGTGQVHCYKDECRPTIIKLNSSNHITLHKVEEKMYSLEVVKAAFEAGREDYGRKWFFHKWFEQNLK